MSRLRPSVIAEWSRAKLCMACWAWVVALGMALVAWNLYAGFPTRAAVVSLLMLGGAVVYVLDMVSTVYGRVQQLP